MHISANPANRLLAALPKKEYRALLPKLERVSLTYNEHLYERGEIIRRVYFPESGIISMLSQIEDGSLIELGIVGSEGMAGIPIFLGAKTSSTVAVVQGAGMADAVTVSDFKDACKMGNQLPSVLLLFVHSFMTQIAQSAACNRFHSADARLARWLLMTRDRMHADEFGITQVFLSNMLGVRREAVNKVAGDLQRRNFIHYSRGVLTILDRQALESVACPCYRMIKQEYDADPG